MKKRDENLDVVRTSRDHESLQFKGSANKSAFDPHLKGLAHTARRHSRQAVRHHAEYRTRCTTAGDGSERGSLMLKARLHPIWVPTGGYRYSVIFRGKLLVERSRDPECDAARALVAEGITGKLTLLDGKTGKPRTIIDIEKAARLTAEEGPNAPRFRRFRGVEEAPTRLKAVAMHLPPGGSRKHA